MPTDDETTKLPEQLDEFDSQMLAGIGFVIVCNQLAKVTNSSQRRIQEVALLEALDLYNLSSPEMIACFMKVNFPVIATRKNDNEG